jgi:uroporphyrin-III C-methyltransferase / precorrin-2 dehydrogenase / sirohydrochlorin ferrochelatase
MSRPYLAGLRLQGREVVVVGGGAVAQRRLPALLAAGADVTVIAPEVTPTVQGLADAGSLRWQQRGFAAGDLAGAWYVLAAAGDAAANAAVAAEAELLRVFCVRADVASGGSAVTPATGRHGSLQVGVLADGRPRRSAEVRDRLLEVVATLPEAGGATGAGRSGVAIVGGGPGDPDLLTLRARRLLAAADVVVVDRLAPQLPLAELAPHVEVVDAAKLPRGPAMAQDAINELLVARARAGAFVVRLKGGDPYVFGRGSEEVAACIAAGVPVIVVPGLSSALAVPALAGIPLTHRGVAHEAVVVSGHLSPGDPGSLVDWVALGRLRGTLVVLMGVERLAEIATVLIRHGRPATTPVAVVQDGSLPGQRITVGTLTDIGERAAAAGVRPPAVIVIGEVVARSAGAQPDGGVGQ